MNKNNKALFFLNLFILSNLITISNLAFTDDYFSSNIKATTDFFQKNCDKSFQKGVIFGASLTITAISSFYFLKYLKTKKHKARPE